MNTLTINTRKNNRFVVPRRPIRLTRRFDQTGRLAMKQLNQAVVRVNGPADPRPIVHDVIVTKVVEYVVTASGSATAVTPATISTALQNAAAFFDVVRLQKISAYGDSSADVHVRVAFPGQDGGDFLDRGTTGALRPQLHLQPTFTMRQTWYDTTATTTLFNVFGSGTVVLQLTVEARSIVSGGT